MIHARSFLILSIFASLALVPSFGCANTDCTAMSAPSRASVSRKVTAPVDASKSIHIELCHNDECRSSDFVPGRAPSTENLCVSQEVSLLDDACNFRRVADGSWSFDANWNVELKNPQNGDRYRVTLTQDGAVLLSVDVRAAYELSEPNGEGCGITKTATL